MMKKRQESAWQNARNGENRKRHSELSVEANVRAKTKHILRSFWLPDTSENREFSHVQAASRPARLGVLLGQALRGASDEGASGPRPFVPYQGFAMGKKKMIKLNQMGTALPVLIPLESEIAVGGLDLPSSAVKQIKHSDV